MNDHLEIVYLNRIACLGGDCDRPFHTCRPVAWRAAIKGEAAGPGGGKGEFGRFLSSQLEMDVKFIQVKSVSVAVFVAEVQRHWLACLNLNFVLAKTHFLQIKRHLAVVRTSAGGQQ